MLLSRKSSKISSEKQLADITNSVLFIPNIQGVRSPRVTLPNLKVGSGNGKSSIFPTLTMSEGLKHEKEHWKFQNCWNFN